ncbi:uncharacterized protein LOC135342805 [Halichondria panicea]|uniref:uncharacterized protein LOC135342805 n=1 Tax=Halichondria panicea TaxID=6063 RepID=UPI00312B61D8
MHILNTEVLGFMVKPEDYESLDHENLGDGLLHWACDRGNLNMVKLLVKRGADVNIEDTDNQTPLHYAVSCDHHAVISYLLQVGFLSQDVIENQAPI